MELWQKAWQSERFRGKLRWSLLPTWIFPVKCCEVRVFYPSLFKHVQHCSVYLRFKRKCWWICTNLSDVGIYLWLFSFLALTLEKKRLIHEARVVFDYNNLNRMQLEEILRELKVSGKKTQHVYSLWKLFITVHLKYRHVQQQTVDMFSRHGRV